MNEPNAHYGLLLGLNDFWVVVEVNVGPEGRATTLSNVGIESEIPGKQ